MHTSHSFLSSGYYRTYEVRRPGNTSIHLLCDLSVKLLLRLASCPTQALRVLVQEEPQARHLEGTERTFQRLNCSLDCFPASSQVAHFILFKRSSSRMAVLFFLLVAVCHHLPACVTPNCHIMRKILGPMKGTDYQETIYSLLISASFVINILTVKARGG